MTPSKIKYSDRFGNPYEIHGSVELHKKYITVYSFEGGHIQNIPRNQVKRIQTINLNR